MFDPKNIVLLSLVTIAWAASIVPKTETILPTDISTNTEYIRIEERTEKYEDILIPYDFSNEVVEKHDEVFVRVARNILNVLAKVTFSEHTLIHLMKGMASFIFGTYGEMLFPILSSAAIQFLESLTRVNTEEIRTTSTQ